MFRPLVALLVLASLLTAPAVATTAADGANDADSRITAVYPDPVARGDAGEFVLLRLPPNETVTLTDGETSVTVTVARGGRVAVTAHPRRVRNLTGYRTVAADRLRLANGGERLHLRRDGGTLDAVAYETATESEVRWFDGRGWRPLGATDFPVRSTGPANATAFVLPDTPGVVRETIRGANRRVLVGAYTFTDPTVARLLERAARRGVTVRVLLEGGPVGGFSRRQARILDGLVAAGVDVRVLAGPRARYRFHHAKYAVVDNRALVLTENWKPAGTGGNASRGWGVRIDDADAASALAATFRADAGWRDARPWRAVRRTRTFESAPAANGTYPSKVAAETHRVSNASVLVAPDNAEDALVSLVDGADDSVSVVGPYAGADGPFVRALVRAAKRGVRVRLLLSGAWYVAPENRDLVDRISELARRDDLPFRARIADPRGRFEKVHAKGMVVDGDTVVVGSVNWNAHSPRRNREVAVVLEGRAVADYYGRVFQADWRGAAWSFPVELVAVVALAVLVAVRAIGVRFRPSS
ncbi:MAG: phospholipase D-like domain-containing protein [Haloferacaceae archaeon]